MKRSHLPLNGLRASVSSAATLANALQVASHLTAAQNITMDGVAITMSNGYPTADVNGIGKAVSADDATFQSSGSGPFTFQVKGATTVASCQFTYTASSGAFPAISTATTSGC